MSSLQNESIGIPGITGYAIIHRRMLCFMHAKMLSHPYDLFGLDGYEELQNYSCDVQNPG